MCDSHESQIGIKKYCMNKLYDAMWIRALNIRFNGHKASNPRERSWAKVVTFAKAYSFQGSLMKIGQYHGKTS